MAVIPVITLTAIGSDITPIVDTKGTTNERSDCSSWYNIAPITPITYMYTWPMWWQAVQASKKQIAHLTC